jgi:hypothetical protein
MTAAAVDVVSATGDRVRARRVRLRGTSAVATADVKFLDEGFRQRIRVVDGKTFSYDRCPLQSEMRSDSDGGWPVSPGSATDRHKCAHSGPKPWACQGEPQFAIAPTFTLHCSMCKRPVGGSFQHALSIISLLSVQSGPPFWQGKARHKRRLLSSLKQPLWEYKRSRRWIGRTAAYALARFESPMFA